MLEPHIFTSTPHWVFTPRDYIAEKVFGQLQKRTREILPESFYSVKALTHLATIQSTRIYSFLKSIPKGVLHHVHLYCCDDYQFYQQYILNDPRIYLNKEMNSFCIGTKEQAEAQGWTSMIQGKSKYGEQLWLQRLISLTSFTHKEFEEAKYQQREMWELFQAKIIAPFKLFFVSDIFQAFLRHVLLKFKSNGYQRVQLKVAMESLQIYDFEGRHKGQILFREVIRIVDRIVDEVSNHNSQDFFGWIEAAFKFLDKQENVRRFRDMCSSNWNLLVGFDFVNQEDRYDNIEKYDTILEQVLRQYPHLSHLKKAYHAGETACHRTNNIDQAVKAGSVRIGHGLNIFQRIQFLPHCRHVCFQKNPLSNLLLGYNKDLRESSTPMLLGLGYPVSISPDDPGKFGLLDTTEDYFVAVMAYNWSLRHLKLVSYHSINHALCQQSTRSHLIRSFNDEWDKWIQSFLNEEKVEQNWDIAEIKQESSMFTSNLHWVFSKQQELAQKKFKKQEEEFLKEVTEDMFSKKIEKLLTYVQTSNLFTTISGLPKGVLHSCHLHYCHDKLFIEALICKFNDFWINRQKQRIRKCSLKPQEEGWQSVSQLSKLTTIGEVASQIYSMTSLSFAQIGSIQNISQFWEVLNGKKFSWLGLLRNQEIFCFYIRYVLKKLSNQGYQRLELRVEPLCFYSEDNSGLSEKIIGKYFRQIEKAVEEIKQSSPTLSVGLILAADKSASMNHISFLLNTVCSLKCPLIKGFDFQPDKPQDQYPPLSMYDQLLDDVLIRHQDCAVHKYYQVGMSRDHTRTDIYTALLGGVKRIANCSSILQNTQLIPRCLNVCFEINPIYQFVSRASGREDIRLSVGAVLLGLQVPVSIGWDYGGLLGIENGSFDLAVMILSSNWSLRHIKLVFLHSLKFSSGSEGEKIVIRKNFEQKWREWVSAYIDQ